MASTGVVPCGFGVLQDYNMADSHVLFTTGASAARVQGWSGGLIVCQDGSVQGDNDGQDGSVQGDNGGQDISVEGDNDSQDETGLLLVNWRDNEAQDAQYADVYMYGKIVALDIYKLVMYGCVDSRNWKCTLW